MRIFRFTARVLFPPLAATLALTVLTSGASRKFYSDDPVWTERDTQDASSIKPWPIDVVADVTENLFTKQGDQTPNVRAKNVNTVDEVPDSSWFTNRVGHRVVTPDEVAKGPNTIQGPAPGRWLVR